MREGEVLSKTGQIPLKQPPAAADVERGMSTSDGGIVEQYAEHLSRKAASAVATMSVVGVLAGAVVGGVPGHLSHSLISPGVNYLAIILGAIAGGFVGRSQGEKKAAGLRLQAGFVLHQGGLAPRAAAPAPVVQAPVAPGTGRSGAGCSCPACSCPGCSCPGCSCPGCFGARRPGSARIRARRSRAGRGGSCRPCPDRPGPDRPCPDRPCPASRSRLRTADGLAAGGTAAARRAGRACPRSRARAGARARAGCVRSRADRPAPRRAGAGNAAALLGRLLDGFAQRRDVVAQRSGALLRDLDRTRADDDSVRELGGRACVLGRRDAEARVERHVDEPRAHVRPALRARARGRRARRSCLSPSRGRASRRSARRQTRSARRWRSARSS